MWLVPNLYPLPYKTAARTVPYNVHLSLPKYSIYCIVYQCHLIRESQQHYVVNIWKCPNTNFVSKGKLHDMYINQHNILDLIETNIVWFGDI